MGIFERIYFNFFSIGALIPTVFFLIISMFLFSISSKSRATFHLVMCFFIMAIMNFAYFFAASVYHPFGAYHRWLTVGVILLAETHWNLFLLNYPEDANPKTEKILLFSLYGVSLIVTVIFFYVTLHSQKIYHFDGHYWDFPTDKISEIIGIIIMLYNLILFGFIFIYKMVRVKGWERRVLLLMGLAFLTATIIPLFTNVLSREGLIDREMFQITWALMNVFGFFLVSIIYINSTLDKTTVVTKIISISMVTFLMMLQGISYFFLNDKELAYDEIHRQQIYRFISAPDYRPPDLAYIISYDTDADALDVPDNFRIEGIDVNLMKIDFQNTFFVEKVAKSSDISNLRQFLKTSEQKHPHLKGYTQSLDHYITNHNDIGDDKRELRAYLTKLDFYVSYYNRKIQKIDNENFRADLKKLLTSMNPAMRDFETAIMNHLDASSLNGGALKYEILQYFQPLHPSGERFYRKLHTEGSDAVSFMHQEPSKNMIYEIGFDYIKYRQYIHSAATKLILILLGLLVFVLVGFRFFFLGILISPLRRLINGVRQVYKGNLNAQVSIRGGDELAYLGQAFNSMVNAIRKSNYELNEVQLYLKNIFDSMPSILIGIDSEGKVTQWNMEAEKATKLCEKDAYGNHIEKLIPQFSGYLQNIQEAIKERMPQKFEKVNYTVKGETRLYDIVVYPLIANGVKGAVIRVDDITSRVRFEEMMVQSEKMASVGGLAAGMAHEINNPISGIMMASHNILRRVSNKLDKNVQAAREVGTDIGAIAKYMEKRQITSMIDGILEMAERASEIVANMLNFSRKSKSEMIPEDLIDLVDKTIDLAANDYDLKKQFDFRRIEIKREYSPSLPKVICIATEIQQVILNLLKNAAQAMSHKTYIHEKPEIKISIFQENKMAIVEIEDNGPGMEEHVRKRIFEPFFTTKDVGVGTGLGLSVSYFIVTNNHGGILEIKSEKDEGATFIIKLPISR
jgi:PAS domain S-box-containing protein